MGSRKTYLLICDTCAEIYVPEVKFDTEEKFAQDAKVEDLLSAVRAEAAAKGWTSHFHASTRRNGHGYRSDCCIECRKLGAVSEEEPPCPSSSTNSQE